MILLFPRWDMDSFPGGYVFQKRNPQKIPGFHFCRRFHGFNLWEGRIFPSSDMMRSRNLLRHGNAARNTRKPSVEKKGGCLMSVLFKDLFFLNWNSKRYVDFWWRQRFLVDFFDDWCWVNALFRRASKSRSLIEWFLTKGRGTDWQIQAIADHRWCIIGGTPRSSILIGFSIINHPFWGTTIFGNTHMIC